ncbi:kelch domain-containing protein 10 homolog, partial [Anastrepha obliqua]|uniref:kelch domain-containing protein 10 homolog n=1 Tax=Anastrepha obliqua TaxID=95512 RepID=UPI00240989B0
RTGYPFGESCSNDCYIYQTTGKKPSVKRIEATGDAPIPQYGPGIVLHEHYLYTIGGTTGYDYSCDVHRLNLRTRVWECVYICRPDIREWEDEGRYRHEVVYDGQYIYVLGGGTSNSSLPKALYFHVAAHSQNGCMYIFGGIEYDEKRIRRCNDLYKMWMTIPLLSEICWEAVLHYRPNLKLNGHSQLLNIALCTEIVAFFKSQMIIQ